jgi:hypothetical protein
LQSDQRRAPSSRSIQKHEQLVPKSEFRQTKCHLLW